MAEIQASVYTALETEDVSPVLRAVATKWAEAAQSAFELLQTTPLSQEDTHTLFAIILETAASVFAPGDLNRRDQKSVVALFKDLLSMTCEQFRDDRKNFIESQEATKQ